MSSTPTKISAVPVSNQNSSILMHVLKWLYDQQAMPNAHARAARRELLLCVGIWVITGLMPCARLARRVSQVRRVRRMVTKKLLCVPISLLLAHGSLA